MTQFDDLDVHTESQGDAVIMTPKGEIDLSRSPVLRASITQVQQLSQGRLVIDLTDVPYMDSSGLATLVEAMQHSRKSGGLLILCGLQDKVQSVFEIARLNMVFTIVNSRDEALTA